MQIPHSAIACSPPVQAEGKKQHAMHYLQVKFNIAHNEVKEKRNIKNM